MKKNKIKIYFFIIISLFFFLSFFSSCKKKNDIKNEEYIIDENQQGHQYIEIDEDDKNIDWQMEKEKLKNIGKLDVRSFSTITVILFREIKDLKGQLEKKKLSEYEIKNEINKKKEELYNYFGITKEQYNEFYRKNKTQIDNFIASHPSYYSEIEVEEGF